jgi:hypothetical protein
MRTRRLALAIAALVSLNSARAGAETNEDERNEVAIEIGPTVGVGTSTGPDVRSVNSTAPGQPDAQTIGSSGRLNFFAMRFSFIGLYWPLSLIGAGAELGSVGGVDIAGNSASAGYAHALISLRTAPRESYGFVAAGGGWASVRLQGGRSIIGGDAVESERSAWSYALLAGWKWYGQRTAGKLGFGQGFVVEASVFGEGIWFLTAGYAASGWM